MANGRRQQQRGEEGGDDSNNNNNNKSRRSSCCRRCCITVTALIGIGLIVGGALWYALPEDTKSQITVPGVGRTTSSPTTSPAPTPSPTAPWRFVQCDDGNDTNDNNCCQGLSGICDLPVNQALYGYMHNAVHTRADDFLWPWHHRRSLEEALQAGYRALELDVSRCNDAVALYHSLCGLGTRDPVEVLNNIGNFLDAHPSEVIVFFWQMPEDESVTLDELHAVVQSTDIASRLYAHNNNADAGTPWPTLGELVSAQQNVIMFYWNQPACQDACPSDAWHYWFDYGTETEFGFGSVSDILDDPAASCAPKFQNRGTDFYRVNSFVTLPSADGDAAETLNAYDTVQQRVAACADTVNLPVNFYAVDFWATGDVPRFVQDENLRRAEEAGR